VKSVRLAKSFFRPEGGGGEEADGSRNGRRPFPLPPPPFFTPSPSLLLLLSGCFPRCRGFLYRTHLLPTPHPPGHTPTHARKSICLLLPSYLMVHTRVFVTLPCTLAPSLMPHPLCILCTYLPCSLLSYLHLPVLFTSLLLSSLCALLPQSFPAWIIV
jgi:hypothetical protein